MLRLIVVVLVLGSFSLGCNVAIIEGTVLDIKGETLPGVAVQVNDDEADVVTNIHGQYKVGYEPGNVTLRFLKTGYTPGRLELEGGGYGSVTAATVSLWPLPQYYGVYLYENFRYRDTMPLVPERWDTITQEVVYGTERWGGVETSNPDPLILCYRMPANGLKLCQLDITEVTPKFDQATNDTIEVWAPTRTIPVTPIMIDEVDGQLMKVGLQAPLEPGCYAIHWGALDGDSTSGETRMFLFHVSEQYPSQKATKAAGAEAAAESPADSQPPAEKENTSVKESSRKQEPSGKPEAPATPVPDEAPANEAPAPETKAPDAAAPKLPTTEATSPEEAPLEDFPDEAAR